MRKKFNNRQGIILIELIIGMIVSVVLLSGMLSLFSTQLKIWTVEKKRISVQEVMRSALASMIEEIRYGKEMGMPHAQVLQITKINGEINTFALGEGLHNKTLYMTIDKRNMIPAGGISINPLTENIVTNLKFIQYPSREEFRAIGITIEVEDLKSGARQVIHTVGYPLNGQ